MRKLLVLLAVLILLGVGADLAGRSLAESKAGESVARKTGTVAPAVDIHGFSFLAQALPGHYPQITLTSAGLTVGPVTGIATVVQLYDVTYPLADAVQGDTTRLTAGRATLNGTVPATVVAAVLTQTFGRPGVTISAGTDGSMRLGATASVAGRTVPVTAELTASFSGGVLHLTAGAVKAAGVAVPYLQQLARTLSVDLPLDKLPFRVTSATVSASGSDLVLTAAANDVSVGAIP